MAFYKDAGVTLVATKEVVTSGVCLPGGGCDVTHLPFLEVTIDL